MKLKRLFLALTQDEKDKVTAAIVEAGIGEQLNSLDFRAFLKEQMFKVTGKSREFIKLFRRLDGREQERFYNAMVSYGE